MKRLNVLINCETTGLIRDQFAYLGHRSTSCDLLPSDQPHGTHMQCDLREALKHRWDFVGFHTDCTYMTNSGVRWLHTEAGRWAKLDEACELFNLCLDDPRPGYLENPIPHKYAVQRIRRNYDQLLQPWAFGDYETKATCLWLKGVPPLVPTYETAEECREALGIAPGIKPKARVHLASPGPNRWKERSKTLPGLARAIAEQFSAHLTNPGFSEAGTPA